MLLLLQRYYDEEPAQWFKPPRTADHGHPLPARPGDRAGDSRRPAGSADVFGGAGQAARARGERARPASGRSIALCLSPGGGAQFGAEIGAPPYGVYIFCRVGAGYRRGAAGSFGGEFEKRGSGSDRRIDRTGEERRRGTLMNLLVE